MPEARTWRDSSRAVPDNPLYAFYLDPAICMSPCSIRISETTNSTLDAEWVDLDSTVERLLVKAFCSVPEVCSICVRREDGTTFVWTLLESYDREVREKVYEKELQICKELRIFDFDFRVTSQDLVSLQELVDSGCHEVFSRK